MEIGLGFGGQGTSKVVGADPGVCMLGGGGGGGRSWGGRLRPCFWRASELHKEGNSVTWAAF